MQEYVVNLNGIEHTMLLSDEDAEKYDAKPVKGGKSTPTKKQDAPANKAAG